MVLQIHKTLLSMEQIKEDFQHVYNLSVESFNKKEYSAFFRNIRPGIEYLSQFLIYDFFGNEEEAEDLINGDTSISKNREDNSYSISSYPANFKPTGRVFCELFPKAYFCKHRDVTSKYAAEEKKRIKRGLDSCSAEMCRYYSIASEMGSHAGRSSMDVEVQARSCAAFFMGFLDYISSNRIASKPAIDFLGKFDKFVFGDVDNTSDYQNQIDNLIKEAEEKDAALLTAQKMQLEAEQSKLIAEQRTTEVELRNKELEDKIKHLQELLDNLTVIVDSHNENADEEGIDNVDMTDSESAKATNTEHVTNSHIFRRILQGADEWDVTEDTMDDDQLDLIEYTDNKSMLVAGCAGSGKSVIAMHKAEQLHKKGKDVILIAYTRSLSRFMRNGKNDSSFRFFHHHLWKYKLRMPKADYIIVDEIQDFTKEEIQEFINAARQHFLFFGDTAQSIYRQYGKQTMTIAQIATMTGLNTLQLFNNYRLPRPVAKIIQDYVGADVQKY